jgi:hypothetical protein
MKIEITEKKLRAALQIAFAEHGLEDESILDTMETYIKALSITAVVQAKPEVCDNRTKNPHIHESPTEWRDVYFDD